MSRMTIKDSKMSSMHLRWRIEFLDSLSSFKISDPLGNRELLEHTLEDLYSYDLLLTNKDKTVIKVLIHLVSSFLSLCNWVHDTMKGEQARERHLAAAQGLALAASEDLSTIEFPVFHKGATGAIEAIVGVKSLEDVKTVVKKLQEISVPVFLGTEETNHTKDQIPSSEEATDNNKGPFVIKVMFTVDGKAWHTPHIVETKTIYDLAAKVTISYWPETTDFLSLDFISTLDRELYKITPLRVDRPKNYTDNEFKIVGHIEFPIGQSVFSEPAIIKVLGTFRSTKDPDISLPATIVGYDQIRVLISDLGNVPILSKYKSIDLKILDLINEIKESLNTIDSGHFEDFIGALSAVTNYLGITLQEATYREGQVIHERDFQADLLRHMRLILGEDVKEAPKQGGGPTDIQYRSVTVELKVEKGISDRGRLVKRYLAQPTQYSSAGGAQLGILCILDLTEKTNPPANPQNNITLETPQLHGFESSQPQFPTKVAVVIIDGNLRLPSSYS